MITYTKRNINFVTLIITILIFICINLGYSFFEQSKTVAFSKQIYSKTIPINEVNVNIEKETINNISIQNNSAENINTNLQQNNEQKKTQRQYVQENKINKWRIQIPKINLDAHIQEGTNADVLLQAVGHFEETSKWSGNVGLAAHNRGYQCNFFQEIKNLKTGDEIIYITKSGKKVYKVQTNKVILETDWSYLQKTKDNRITLITCEENRREYRRCIQAIEI